MATQLTTLQVAPLQVRFLLIPTCLIIVVQRDFARLRACTALRVLDVYVPTGLACPSFEFPLLTNLYIGFEVPPSLAKVVSIFRSVIASCPLLRVLSLELPPMSKPSLGPLESAIADAERRGLEQLCLCVHDATTHTQLRQLNARFQWLEIEVALPLHDGPQILEITDLDLGQG